MRSLRAITARLDGFQRTVAALEAQARALQALTGEPDGPLFTAIYDMLYAHTELVAESVGCGPSMLEQWHLDHDFGARPMRVDGRRVTNNRRFAWFILSSEIGV